MAIGKFFSFSKIDTCTDYPNLYRDTFQYFTVTTMEKYPGRISENYDITIKSKGVGSFLDLTNELKINYIENEFNLNKFISDFFTPNQFFTITLKDRDIILEIKDCEWDTVVKDLDQNFINIPQDINLLKGKINAAQRYKSNSITLSPNEEIFFKSKMPFFNLYELNYETFQNFQNKVKKYNVNINNDIHSQENYACKIGSTITIIDLVSKNKKQKIFPKEIALKACVSEDEILAVELINEHIYSNEYGNYHFKGKPNPTYHVIKIYDLLTNKLLNIIRLPLPQNYCFEDYGFSLYGIQNNNVYIYDQKEKHYIQIEFNIIEFNINEEYTGNQVCDTKVPLTITPDKNDFQDSTNQNQEKIEQNNPAIQKNDSINPVPTEPVNRSKKSIIGYIKQRIKYIAFIPFVFIAFLFFKNITHVFHQHDLR